MYGVWEGKKLYGRNSCVVRSTFLIDHDGRIAYIWFKVVEKVLEKLSELKSKM